MSNEPFVRSADLRQLRSDGFTVRLVHGKLVVEDIPYVDHQRVVHADGILVMPIELAGDIAQRPPDHAADWIGGVPCTADGSQLYLVNSVAEKSLGDGIVASCYFSRKPVDLPDGGYLNYYDKVRAYAAAVGGPAAAIDAAATPLRKRPVTADELDGPFRYVDTASSRARIDALNERLDDEVLGIIGMGGTGAYLLDLAAKTRALEIHLFDGDVQLTHNAFRSPGAPTLEELRVQPNKAKYWAAAYDPMRSGIVAHCDYVRDANLHELDTLTFVFLALDDPEAKRPIIEYLCDKGIPFIDVGMGVSMTESGLTGAVRTTTCVDDRSHARRRIATSAAPADDYSTNVQIAELNALNACLAIIRWKKLRGIYADLGNEHHSVYAITTNAVINDEIGPDSGQ
jgi:hypothetical protein